MNVRSTSESLDRYVKHSMRAFLEGEQNLKWVVGVVNHSGASIERAFQLFQQLNPSADIDRYRQLLNALVVSMHTSAPDVLE
jgi:hypothetical protein